MGSIYACADKIRVWLGQDVIDVHNASRLITWLGRGAPRERNVLWQLFIVPIIYTWYLGMSIFAFASIWPSRNDCGSFLTLPPGLGTSYLGQSSRYTRIKPPDGFDRSPSETGDVTLTKKHVKGWTELLILM
jgi:hypothetical protein